MSVDQGSIERGAVQIARCPEHGLHGRRETCFECGGPVEQVLMVPVGSIERDCPECDGPGGYAAPSCETCGGSGKVKEPERCPTCDEGKQVEWADADGDPFWVPCPSCVGHDPAWRDVIERVGAKPNPGGFEDEPSPAPGVPWGPSEGAAKVAAEEFERHHLTERDTHSGGAVCAECGWSLSFRGDVLMSRFEHASWKALAAAYAVDADRLRDQARQEAADQTQKLVKAVELALNDMAWEGEAEWHAENLQDGLDALASDPSVYREGEEANHGE